MLKNGQYAQAVLAQSLTSTGSISSDYSSEHSPTESNISMANMYVKSTGSKTKMSSEGTIHDLQGRISTEKGEIESIDDVVSSLESKYNHKEYSGKTLYKRLGSVTRGVKYGYFVAIVFAICKRPYKALVSFLNLSSDWVYDAILWHRLR